MTREDKIIWAGFYQATAGMLLHPGHHKYGNHDPALLLHYAASLADQMFDHYHEREAQWHLSELSSSAASQQARPSTETKPQPADNKPPTHKTQP